MWKLFKVQEKVFRVGMSLHSFTKTFLCLSGKKECFYTSASMYELMLSVKSTSILTKILLHINTPKA